MSRSIGTWALPRAYANACCKLLAGLLLLVQLAVAAHACSLAMPPRAEAAMPGCAEMPAPADSATPNLCLEHCRQGQQSDQVHAPALPVPALIGLYRLPHGPEAGAGRSTAAAEPCPAAASPPLPILHCRLRD